MLTRVSSYFMRTTLDIDKPVLAKLKALQKREGKSLGRLVSDLLAVALRRQAEESGEVVQGLEWTTQSMNARVNLADREALYEAMEGDDGS
jgi:hypothetical protein